MLLYLLLFTQHRLKRIWRTCNQDIGPHLDGNKVAKVRRDIFRNSRLTNTEKNALKYAAKKDQNIRHQKKIENSKIKSTHL